MAEPILDPALPAEVKPDARKIAIVGEIPFAGYEIAKAITAAGMTARVLNPNSAVEAKLRELPLQQNLEIVDGDLGNLTAVSSVLEGVYGVCFVSPIGLGGRLYRSSEHIKDVAHVIQAAETHALRKLVYHSAVGALVGAQSRALQDSAAAEELISNSRCEDFRIRTGPIMGKNDGFMTEIVKDARAPSPVMTISGYGATLVQPLAIADFAQCMANVFTPSNDGLHNGVYSLVGPETYSLLDLTDAALGLLKRNKIKIHIPLFALKMLSSISSSAKFKERVGMLFDAFAVEQNDVTKLLGAGPKLSTPADVQRALVAGS
jgi:uncharacterized protein YbjT (DUF2867 family)